MFDATSVFGAVALPKPPAPPSLPLIGNYFQLKNDSLEFLRRAARDYGDVSLLLRSLLYCLDPQATMT